MELELTRRRFLGGATALLASTPAASYAAAVGAGKPALRIGILSDIHISPADYMKQYLLGDPAYHRPRETDLFEKALAYFDLRGADAVEELRGVQPDLFRSRRTSGGGQFAAHFRVIRFETKDTLFF